MANIVFRDPGEKPRARPELYDKKAAAEYLRTSLRKLEYMMADGRVRYGKMGGSVVFRRVDLDAALEQIFAARNGEMGNFSKGNLS